MMCGDPNDHNVTMTTDHTAIYINNNYTLSRIHVTENIKLDLVTNKML